MDEIEYNYKVEVVKTQVDSNSECTDYFGCEAPLVPMRDIIQAETVDVVLDEDVPKLSFSLFTDNGEFVF